MMILSILKYFSFYHKKFKQPFVFFNEERALSFCMVNRVIPVKKSHE